MSSFDYNADYTSGPDALWTAEERSEWRKQAFERNALAYSDLARQEAALSRLTRKFEQEMFDFASTGFGGFSCDAAEWYRQVAFEVNGTYELPEAGKGETFTEVRDRMVAEFVGNLHDDEAWDEDHTQEDEVLVVLWLAKLSVYRLFAIKQKVEEAAMEAVRENLLEMACEAVQWNRPTSGNRVQEAARKAMEAECKALWNEFKAGQSASKVA